jgi:2-polyprenyl-6-methoxyphenol hydroxylase-like FAD-dependent oxidoreductase
MMVGFLLARSGVPVTVLEKHGDFLRDFRGDTIHPSTMEVMDQLGLAERVLALRHTKVATMHLDMGHGPMPVVDFTRLPSRFPYIVFVPQWDFLNLLAEEARKLPSFTLHMNAAVDDLIQEGDRVCGVRYQSPEGTREARADLVIAADGRGSVVRARADLPLVETAPPIDVLWFRISRLPSDPEDFTFRVGNGHMILLVNRFDYWQVAFVIPKGGDARVRAEGLGALQATIARLAPELGERVRELADWDRVKLLTVQSNRLTRWHRPGLLCIGDAAHAMSPVGGVGINLAIQDAVATANRLTTPLVEGRVSESDLAAIQRRRTLPTVLTQRVQALAQTRLTSRVLANRGLPAAVQLFPRWGVLRRLAARLVGFGIRPERVS